MTALPLMPRTHGGRQRTSDRAAPPHGLPPCIATAHYQHQLRTHSGRQRTSDPAAPPHALPPWIATAHYQHQLLLDGIARCNLRLPPLRESHRRHCCRPRLMRPANDHQVSVSVCVSASESVCVKAWARRRGLTVQRPFRAPGFPTHPPAACPRFASTSICASITSTYARAQILSLHS